MVVLGPLLISDLTFPYLTVLMSPLTFPSFRSFLSTTLTALLAAGAGWSLAVPREHLLSLALPTELRRAKAIGHVLVFKNCGSRGTLENKQN